MKRIDYHAKAEHFAELARRAAYCAAIAPNHHDRDEWDERACLYDARVAHYQLAARKAS